MPSNTPNAVGSGGEVGTRDLRVPDHELLYPIASGAYGEVWLARNVVRTLRAVKVVRRDQHAAAESFEREFKGLQKFEPVSRSHEGLVDILTLGLLPDGAGFYYVMELADDGSESRLQPDARGKSASTPQPAQAGTPNENRLKAGIQTYSPRTLRHDLKQHGHLAVDNCIQIGLKLTSALAHLHAQGLVHRDVKPSNILFIGGEPKLADAGLVAAVDDAHSLVGTAGYIAPEGPGTAQADLYALGKVLYEAAFGKDRQEFPALPADLASRPDHARLLELNEIIATACAHDPKQRYTSADVMLADLRHLADGRSLKRRRAWHEKRRLALRLGASTGVVVVAWLILSRFNESTSGRFHAAVPASVFVLPFRNEGNNRVDTDLRERMTDAFITSLKLINGVTVAPRRSALADRPEAEARAEAARLFGVRYVLTGQVRKADNLTLSLGLHESSRKRAVWERTFTGTTNGLISVEEQAIQACATSLNATITPETLERLGQALTNNLAAWRLVQLANEQILDFTRESLTAALPYCNKALQLDPDYIGAWAQKAQICRLLTGDREPDEIWPEAKACAERMLQVDPTSEQGQYFRWLVQWIYEWDWGNADRTFQERRARNADGPVVTALYLRTVGRFDEARVEQAKAERLDQGDPYVRNHLTAAAFVERDYRRVIELAKQTQTFYPEKVHYDLFWMVQGYYHLGEFEKAIESVRQLRKMSDQPVLIAMEACALSRVAQTEAARKLLADLNAMSGLRYVDPYPLAWVHVALNDKAGALARLREACKKHSEFVVFPDSLGGLRTDPKLDELRAEPEFQELLKLAGLDVWPKPEMQSRK